MVVVVVVVTGSLPFAVRVRVGSSRAPGRRARVRTRPLRVGRFGGAGRMAGGMAGAGVEQMIEASVLAAARAMEDKVDEEIERLDKVGRARGRRFRGPAARAAR